ncbi:MAG: IS1634 family transposase [Thermodesulfobacteriota bacterium]
MKKETVGNLSHLPEPLIDLIRRYLKGEQFAGVDELFDIERSLPHGHVAAVLGTLRGLAVDQLLGKRPSRKKTLCVAMIVARILDPCSKLATCRELDEESPSHSLGEVLGIGQVDVDEMYGAMDWLLTRQSGIEDGFARRHLSEGALCLYDVTSSYFEGRKCPLAKRGLNRDGKKGKLQIVIGLLCNAQGCPVSIEVFDGNTADPKTLVPQIEKLRTRFGLGRVVPVRDRGMITDARLVEDVRPNAGLDWITALRAPAIRELADAGLVQLSLLDQMDLAEITHPDYPGERLIVCRNPLLAEDRARTRQELIEATEKGLNKIVEATTRSKRRLKGTDKIAMKVGKALGRFKVGKYFKTEITDESFRYCRNKDRIDRDAELDGFYVIRTNVPGEELSASDTVRAYKSLSVVERAFRSLKTVDLKIRPIHHHLGDRVKAHVFLCMLAYYVEWHMRSALAPILFDDDHKAEAQALRKSVVAPAARSDHALAKAQKRRTDDGIPIHSFQTLLEHLGTLTKNLVRVPLSGHTFSRFSRPSPTQQKAFDLLGISYSM